MDRSTRILATRLLLAGGVISLTAPASADFIKDSKASLELRNFYFNRDYRQTNAAQSKQEEWAQGFLLRYESGFTDGLIGVGVDAIGLLGVNSIPALIMPVPACSNAIATPAKERRTSTVNWA